MHEGYTSLSRRVEVSTLAAKADPKNNSPAGSAPLDQDGPHELTGQRTSLSDRTGARVARANMRTTWPVRTFVSSGSDSSEKPSTTTLMARAKLKR
jgi:hypothetical protein